jgi:MscS family membrane protein
VQQEYRYVLNLIGLDVITETQNKRTVINLEETNVEDSLIELIRTWYRISIRDPNVLDTDEFMIPDDWERKIAMLKRRIQRLCQKISKPEREETRLDDYVLQLNQ